MYNNLFVRDVDSAKNGNALHNYEELIINNYELCTWFKYNIIINIVDIVLRSVTCTHMCTTYLN